MNPASKQKYIEILERKLLENQNESHEYLLNRKEDPSFKISKTNDIQQSLSQQQIDSLISRYLNQVEKGAVYNSFQPQPSSQKEKNQDYLQPNNSNNNGKEFNDMNYSISPYVKQGDEQRDQSDIKSNEELSLLSPFESSQQNNLDSKKQIQKFQNFNAYGENSDTFHVEDFNLISEQNDNENGERNSLQFLQNYDQENQKLYQDTLNILQKIQQQEEFKQKEPIINMPRQQNQKQPIIVQNPVVPNIPQNNSIQQFIIRQGTEYQQIRSVSPHQVIDNTRKFRSFTKMEDSIQNIHILEKVADSIYKKNLTAQNKNPRSNLSRFYVQSNKENKQKNTASGNFNENNINKDQNIDQQSEINAVSQQILNDYLNSTEQIKNQINASSKIQRVNFTKQVTTDVQAINQSSNISQRDIKQITFSRPKTSVTKGSRNIIFQAQNTNFAKLNNLIAQRDQSQQRDQSFRRIKETTNYSPQTRYTGKGELLPPTAPQSRANSLNSQKVQLATQEVPLFDVMNDMRRYEKGELLGQGSYATVREGIDLLTKKKVAIKTYDQVKLADPQRLDGARREISILEKISHPNIIKLYASVETPTEINLILELFSQQNLKDFLKKQPENKINEGDAKNIFGQIINAISFCHEKKVSHRDIKLENILIDITSTSIQIIDFGFAVQLTQNKQLNLFCGTPSYMAPEIVQQTSYYANYVDIWALGILLYTIICGRCPFKGRDDDELYKKIIQGELNFPMNVSDQARELIENMLKISPEDRMDTDKILDDQWFED